MDRSCDELLAGAGLPGISTVSIGATSSNVEKTCRIAVL
jgi:hypothetical protein